jgi:hypothetical protein
MRCKQQHTTTQQQRNNDNNNTCNNDARTQITELADALVPASHAAVLQPTIKLDKTGPSKVVNAGEMFDFELTASIISGTVTSMVLTDPMPAGSGLRLIKPTPAAPTCVITESLARCTLTGPSKGRVQKHSAADGRCRFHIR